MDGEEEEEDSVVVRGGRERAVCLPSPLGASKGVGFGVSPLSLCVCLCVRVYPVDTYIRSPTQGGGIFFLSFLHENQTKNAKKKTKAKHDQKKKQAK